MEGRSCLYVNASNSTDCSGRQYKSLTVKTATLGFVTDIWSGLSLFHLLHPSLLSTFFILNLLISHLCFQLFNLIYYFSGLFATVRKCTHRETGIEYAAKFSSRYENIFFYIFLSLRFSYSLKRLRILDLTWWYFRLRYEVDYTMAVLHEIALLSMCTGSNKIVHLKDVFQNKQELILVLE